jgi:hypothetical protein
MNYLSWRARCINERNEAGQVPDRAAALKDKSLLLLFFRKEDSCLPLPEKIFAGRCRFAGAPFVIVVPANEAGPNRETGRCV